MNDSSPSNTPTAAPTSIQATSPASIGSEDRNMALLMYILAIFTGFIGPLIIWLIKKDSSAFINDQGKEVLNFRSRSFWH